MNLKELGLLGLCSVSDVRVLTGVVVVMLSPDVNDGFTTLCDELTNNVVAELKLVYGMFFVTVGLIMLIILQIAYIIVLGKWNEEIFSAIIALLSLVIGVFFGNNKREVGKKYHYFLTKIGGRI